MTCPVDSGLLQYYDLPRHCALLEQSDASNLFCSSSRPPSTLPCGGVARAPLPVCRSWSRSGYPPMEQAPPHQTPQGEPVHLHREVVNEPRSVRGSSCAFCNLIIAGPHVRKAVASCVTPPFGSTLV